MIKTIQERLNWCNKRLSQIIFAQKTFEPAELPFAYGSGRIRELENQIAFLEGIIKGHIKGKGVMR